MKRAVESDTNSSSVVEQLTALCLFAVHSRLAKVACPLRASTKPLVLSFLWSELASMLASTKGESHKDDDSSFTNIRNEYCSETAIYPAILANNLSSFDDHLVM